MKRLTVGIAAVLIVLANAWALVSVWLNRADSPGGTVELTERELRLDRVSDESTVLFLEIEWDTLYSTLPGESRRRGNARWLDAAKMAELGFPPLPVPTPTDEEFLRYRCYTTSVYAVLEFEGEAWRQAPIDRRRTTRLFAIDAGRDPQLLRERYPDSTRHIITRALIKPFLERRTSPEGEPRPPRLGGSLRRLVPASIFVPRPYNGVLADLPELDRDFDPEHSGEPRFTAVVSWGADYSPWLREVRRKTTGALDAR